MSTDDLRRVREIWVAVETAIINWQPVALAIEGYSPIPGKQGHGSWKVGGITYMLIGLCWSRGIEPIIVRPSDLRRRFLSKESGSKVDIEHAVALEVWNADAILQKIAPSKREHLADAIGYAVIAYEEMQRIRRVAGLEGL